MENEGLTKSLTALTEQITNNQDVELIYYTTTSDKDNITSIECTVVCNTENIIKNTNLLKLIVTNMDIIRTLYSKTQIKFNYSIKSIKAIERNKLELKKIKKATILYPKYNKLENNQNNIRK